MLDPYSRLAIIALSGLCAAWAFTLTPARARDAVERFAAVPHPGATPPPPPAVAPLAIVRDPFAERPGGGDAGQMPPSAPAFAGDTRVEPLPSNLATDVIPAIPGATASAPVGGARVTAVVTGLHRYAMVEIAGVHAIKGIGDRVGGVPVVAIDLDGIRLANGVHLAVDMGANAR